MAATLHNKNILYINDSKGNIQSVQLPITEWNKIQLKIRKYEQMLKIGSDLKAAFKEVDVMERSKVKQQTLSEFLNEL